MASNRSSSSRSALGNDGLLASDGSTRSNAILAVGLVAILATLIIPLPTFMLDLLLACSISLGIAVLIVTLSSKEALELSTFPSLLLFITLFRLSLNVASTRLILLNGDAGKIIHTFGSFVAGGSFVVGFVIFLILVIIQFIVITKGAERISEVSARFTLDALPGKQMAIDADLNAGAITEKQANDRRAKIVKESEFYGAMDGASKFIRGDAKAGIIITAVNIIGGIAMGYSRGMTVVDALKTYTILSIGDGLVSQIPSLIISVSSGFIVTKISSSHSVGQDISKQFFKAGQPLVAASGIIAAMALVPGMPKIPFLALAGGAALFGRMSMQDDKKAPEKTPQKAAKKTDKEPVEELLDIDRVSVHVGVRLITMVDPRKTNTIFDRIGALRRQFAQRLGIILPLVRLKDDLNLDANTYEIRLSEIAVAQGVLQPQMFLAMDPGGVRAKVDGIATTEPVYGLPALWITAEKKEEAELSGYTVIDAESVFITHLSETLRKHASELLSREDVQSLVDRLRKTQPSLVGEVLGSDSDIGIGLLQRVLKNLLASGIPIRELTTILEALAENAPRIKNPNTLTEVVRKSLGRTITEQYKNNGRVAAITFDPPFEHQLTAGLTQENGELALNLPAETAMQINRSVATAWRAAMDQGHDKVVLLCDARLRSPLSRMLSRTLQMLPVIAYDEIVLGTDVDSVQTVGDQSSETTLSQNPQEMAGAPA